MPFSDGGQTSSPDHLLDAAEPAVQKGSGDLATRLLQGYKTLEKKLELLKLMINFLK